LGGNGYACTQGIIFNNNYGNFCTVLKKYWKLCALVVVLALVNQLFSLMEPYITQQLVDKYAMHYASLSQAVFLRGVGLLVLAFIGTALVSRVAKNFQDYYLNTVSKRSGADMYREGVKHSLALPV
jgi:ATP-binding cassette subfamily B protein